MSARSVMEGVRRWERGVMRWVDVRGGEGGGVRLAMMRRGRDRLLKEANEDVGARERRKEERKSVANSTSDERARRAKSDSLVDENVNLLRSRRVVASDLRCLLAVRDRKLLLQLHLDALLVLRELGTEFVCEDPELRRWSGRGRRRRSGQVEEGEGEKPAVGFR